MLDGALRVAIVAPDFPPNVGGVPIYNGEVAQRLAALGHDVRVFTWAEPRGDAAGSDARMPFPVHRTGPRRILAGILQPEELEATLARWRPQVAFVSGACKQVSLLVSAAARCAPVVSSIHDLRDRGRLGRLRGWRVRRRYRFDLPRRFVANAEHTRLRLERMGIEPGRIAVVYPGVDTRRFTPDPEAAARLRRECGLDGRRLLLTVSRLTRHKGHATVLEALALLRGEFPDLAYAVVGEGRIRGQLARRAEELGVADLVHFAGAVERVEPWYAACDVYVMPSSPTGGGSKAAEGFGMAYIEAGSCGKPVIASSSGGGREIVVEGETGHLVDPGDAVGLAAVLRGLLARPERARAMGEKARQRARRFDWSAGVATLAQVLRDAATAELGENSRAGDPRS
jgi:phosphatidylinositol alpha-1,6-mannosyltransferase